MSGDTFGRRIDDRAFVTNLDRWFPLTMSVARILTCAILLACQLHSSAKTLGLCVCINLPPLRCFINGISRPLFNAMKRQFGVLPGVNYAIVLRTYDGYFNHCISYQTDYSCALNRVSMRSILCLMEGNYSEAVGVIDLPRARYGLAIRSRPDVPPLSEPY